MAELINGRNVMLYRYDTDSETDIPFACMTACSLSVNLGLRDVTNSASGNYAESEADLISWTISGSGLMILNTQQNYLSLLNYITQREKITVKFVIDNGGVLGLSIFAGQVYISSLSLDAPDDTLSTYSVSLVGSGQYSIAGTTVTPGGIIITGGSIIQVFQAVATEGQSTFTFAGAIGLDLLYASRGGISIQPIGTLTGNGATWNAGTGTMTLATPSVEGEQILILAQ